ncbi:hypothetical protein CcrKarma_gp312 [Caulobacter virus Karma]|uniref:hypothetical protein n=1 Tax=Caulobacter virus Karma TaxID=1211641 RepID=UPI00028B0447|nr:hypothetical protein CcrKarma_gp312 [Caulobacter virus Karma]AFU87829.1 hypothetical protein CcrKarma_gp312 [Caulobacter virus Karma]
MKVPLKQCPPGPFLYEGVLGFKTEYGAMSTRELPSPPLSGRHQREWYVTDHADAYCMSSGEAFWAGAKTREERDELLVQPLYEGWLKLNRPSDREPSALERALVECIAVASLYDNPAGVYAKNILDAIRTGGDEGLKALASPLSEVVRERDRLKQAIDTALVQISGGLCYFTADAKHAQLRDAEKTLERALNGDETPFEKRVYGEEPAADWSLELHVFHAANNPDLPQATRELLKTLWKAYCEMEQRCEGAST